MTTLNELKAERNRKEGKAFAPIVARGTTEGICDVIIVDDSSGSIEKYKNEKINAMVNYAKALRNNAKCRSIVRTTVVEFGTGVELLAERLNPKELEQFLEGAEIRTIGMTDGYKALAAVNSMINDLIDLYNPETGRIPHNRIRVFWITDGFFNDSVDYKAIEEYQSHMNQSVIQSYFVGLGEDFNIEVANMLARSNDQIFGSYDAIENAFKAISNSVITGSVKPGANPEVHFSCDNDCVLLDVKGNY